MNLIKQILLKRISDKSKNRLESFKQYSLNKYCVILGNGPSLSKVDFSIFDDKTVLYATNRAILHKDFDKLTNVNYILSDNYFFQEKEGKKILKKIDKAQNINNIIVPSSWFYYRLFRSKNSKKYIYVNYKRDEELKNFKFTNDIYSGLRVGHTIVLDFCLPLAIFAGFKKIFLIGCDFDYSKKTQYFYGKNLNNKNFKKNHGTEKQEKSWKNNIRLGFERINDFCTNNQIEVLNCSNEKLLQVFKQTLKNDFG